MPFMRRALKARGEGVAKEAQALLDAEAAVDGLAAPEAALAPSRQAFVGGTAIPHCNEQTAEDSEVEASSGEEGQVDEAAAPVTASKPAQAMQVLKPKRVSGVAGQSAKRRPIDGVPGSVRVAGTREEGAAAPSQSSKVHPCSLLPPRHN